MKKPPVSIEWLISQPFLREEDVDRLPEKVRLYIRKGKNWEWSPMGIYVNSQHPENQKEVKP